MQKQKVPSFFRTRQTGEAQLEFNGSFTPVSCMSFKISSSASRAANDGFLGD